MVLCAEDVIKILITKPDIGHFSLFALVSAAVIAVSVLLSLKNKNIRAMKTGGPRQRRWKQRFHLRHSAIRKVQQIN